MTPRQRQDAVHAIEQTLLTLRLDGPGFWPSLAESLGGLYRGKALVYGFRPGARGVQLAFAETSGVPRALVETTLWGCLTDAVLAHDPLDVPPEEANRVTVLSDLERAGRVDEGMNSRWQARTKAAFGAPVTDQLRLLVCEGRTALAWVGSMSFEAGRAYSTTDVRQLQRLSSKIIERVQLEERLGRTPLMTSTLDAILQNVEHPVWLLDAEGAPVLCNTPARDRLDRRARLTRLELREAVRESHAGLRVAPVVTPHGSKYWLVMAQTDSVDAMARLGAAATEWRLTARQREVLALVARGLPNHAIAREVGCSMRAVELHLTHLMRRARVDNRATLVARVWSGVN